MSRQTTHRLMRSFRKVTDERTGIVSLAKRANIQEPMDITLIPCLNCGQKKVRQSYGQIVRFCSKECKSKFKHGYLHNG